MPSGLGDTESQPEGGSPWDRGPHLPPTQGRAEPGPGRGAGSARPWLRPRRRTGRSGLDPQVMRPAPPVGPVSHPPSRGARGITPGEGRLLSNSRAGPSSASGPPQRDRCLCVRPPTVTVPGRMQEGERQGTTSETENESLVLGIPPPPQIPRRPSLV